jgi:hypothetical protein
VAAPGHRREQAGGNVYRGGEFVAKSPPDGYTLIVAAVGTLAVNLNVYAKLPYDPTRDYAGHQARRPAADSRRPADLAVSASRT